MNLLDFATKKLNNKIEREEIIDKLLRISKKMKGRMCFESSLRPGQSSGFLIYCLDEYFKNNNKLFETYLEIGTLYGGSLCALYDSGFSGKSYAVDIFEGYYGDFGIHHTPHPAGYPRSSDGHMQVVKDNVSLFGHMPECILGNTQDKKFVSEIIPKLDIPELDVLYIDGDHSYRGSISDFDAFCPYVKQDGLILLDNYEIPGVRQTSKEITEKHSSLVEEVGVWNNSTWIGRKIVQNKGGVNDHGRKS